MPIESNVSHDGQALTISVKGRFDFSSSFMFRNAYERQDDQPKTFFIDLKESDYLDSSALGVLLALRDYAGGNSSDIRIINCTPDVKKIFVTTKLDELFTVE